MTHYLVRPARMGGPVVIADATTTSEYDPRSSPADPRPGETVLVGSRASVQFQRPFLFCVARVLDRRCGDGWAWLEGYQLDTAGDAVEWRQILVQVAGLVKC